MLRAAANLQPRHLLDRRFSSTPDAEQPLPSGTLPVTIRH
jgi:hypothetical protein